MAGAVCAVPAFLIRCRATLGQNATEQSVTQLARSGYFRGAVFDNHLPKMWAFRARIDADGSVSVFLRVQRLRRTAETAQGRLLRVLFIRRFQVPARPGRDRLLYIASPVTTGCAIQPSMRRSTKAPAPVPQRSSSISPGPARSRCISTV